MTETGPENGDRAAQAAADGTPEKRRFEDLPPAARRALKEAEARRRTVDAAAEQQAEIGGRGGKDPARYGDWEIDGRAVDF